jgi:hypothetical protein
MEFRDSTTLTEIDSQEKELYWVGRRGGAVTTCHLSTTWCRLCPG